MGLFFCELKCAYLLGDYPLPELLHFCSIVFDLFLHLRDIIKENVRGFRYCLEIDFKKKSKYALIGNAFCSPFKAN